MKHLCVLCLCNLTLISCSNTEAPSAEENDGGLRGSDTTRGAAILASCLDGLVPFMDGVDGLQGGGEELFTDISDWAECLASSSNACLAVSECTAMSMEPSSELCNATCDGSVVMGCDGESAWSFDCAKNKNGKTACHPGPGCVSPPTETCSTAAFEESCDGNQLVYCEARYTGDFVTRRACPFGSLCQIDATGSAQCVGTGQVCKASQRRLPSLRDSVVGCATDTAVEMCAGGNILVVDCAEYVEGYSCQKRGEAAFCGLASECSPGEAFCVENELVLCAAGKREIIDCTQLGFERCESGRCGPKFPNK